MIPTAPPLTRGVTLWYGFGQLAEGLKNEAFSVLLLFYYTQVLGLDGAFAGGAVLLALIFDAVSDPVAGAVSDRLRSRWGRRHPFLYASALPVSVCFYLVFAPPPGLSQLGLFTWLACTAIATRLSMTLFHVPHMALGAELSPDFQERTTIVTLQYAFARSGHAISGILAFLVFLRPTPEYPTGQLNPAGYPPLALTLSVLMFVTILLSAHRTHSRIPYLVAPESSDGQRGVLREMMSDLAGNLRSRAFRALFFGNTLTFVAFGVATALGLYNVTYFWFVGLEQLLVWGIASGIGIFGGLAFWHRLAGRTDKKPVFIHGLLTFTVFTALPPFLVITGFWPARASAAYVPLWMLTTGFLAHFGIASTMVTGRSMMADVGDEYAVRTGGRREGILFAAISFAAKASFGVGSLIAGQVVRAVGLVPGAAPNEVGADVTRGLGLATGIFVLALCGLSLVIFSRYDLDRQRHAELQASLAGSDPAPAPDVT